METMRTEHRDKNIMIQRNHQATVSNIAPVPPALHAEYTDKQARIAKIAVSLMLGIPLIAILLTVAILLYRVPSGAEAIPFLLASVHLTDIPYFEDHPPIEVFINDVGAAHRGNFWTWVVIPDTLPGRRKVIAQGYSSAYVRYHDQEFPFEWTGRTTFRVKFAQGRYNPNNLIVVEGSLEDEVERTGR